MQKESSNGFVLCHIMDDFIISPIFLIVVISCWFMVSVIVGLVWLRHYLFLQQIAEHQTGSEFAGMLKPLGALSIVLGRFGVDILIYLAGEEGDEFVLLVEAEHFWLVLGIDDGKAAFCLVVFVEEPYLDEAEHCRPDASARELCGHGQTTYEHAGIAGEHLFTMGNLPHGVAPTAGQVIDADAVVGDGEAGHDGLRIVLEAETVGLAHEELGVVERVLAEELVHVVVSSAGEGMA